MNEYLRGTLLAAGLALSALYSPGCKKDEPIVVRPRVSCDHGHCDDHNYVHARPAENGDKKDRNARSHGRAYVRGLPVPVYVIDVDVQYGMPVPRAQLSGYNPFEDENARQEAVMRPGHNPFQETGRPVVNRGRSSNELMPNPYTGCNAGSGSSAGNAGSGSGPASGSSGNAEPSLEQRLRDCVELNRQLEQQVNDAMVPGDGRG